MTVKDLPSWPLLLSKRGEAHRQTPRGEDFIAKDVGLMQFDHKKYSMWKQGWCQQKTGYFVNNRWRCWVINDLSMYHQKLMNTFSIIIRQDQFTEMIGNSSTVHWDNNSFTPKFWVHQHVLASWIINKLIRLGLVSCISSCRQFSCQMLGKSTACFGSPLGIKRRGKIRESMIECDEFPVQFII